MPLEISEIGVRMTIKDEEPKADEKKALAKEPQLENDSDDEEEEAKR